MAKWILPIILGIALVVTGYWGYTQYVRNLDYSTHMENIYQKSFYELVGNVGNVENGLAKLMVSGDKNQHIILLSEIGRQSDTAQLDLGQLPISHHALNKTYKYLNQVSDYAYYLNKKISEGKTLSVEEMDNLKKLYENAASLTRDLQELNSSIQAGGITWGELSIKGKTGFQEASKNIIDDGFVNIQKTSIDYPRLIYDGPFSETLKDGVRHNKLLKGKAVTLKQAQEIAADFVGRDRIQNISEGSAGKGDIDTWGVNIETRDAVEPIFVSVSKQGGKVVNMIAAHGPREERISIQQAKDKAKKFLEENGYENMVPTYEQKYSGVCVINFAYMDGDVICYPDLIKVKVALNDGAVLGFEALNYLTAHRERDLDEPELTMDEAKKLVNPNLKIKSGRLALIPQEHKKERLCYEFKGSYGNNRFIVYIDAMTGQEADILQLIDTENGTLAM